VREGVPLAEAGRKRNPPANYPGNTVTVTPLAFQSIGCYSVTKKEARAWHCGPQDADFGLGLVGFDQDELDGTLVEEASVGLAGEDAVPQVAQRWIKRNHPIVL
jgi:hypothetical protein